MNKKPIGIEAGKLVLENICSRFQTTYSVFNEILQAENKILSYKDNIFLSYEDYKFFRDNFIIIAGKKEFDYYEKEFLMKVIYELKFNLFNSNVIYNIVEIEKIKIIEVSVLLNQEEFPIMYINPYFKVIEIVEDDYTKKLKKEMSEYKEEISKLKNEEKKIELIIKKPILGSESPLDMINTAFKRKKKVDEMKKKLNEVQNIIMDYEIKITDCKNLLREFNSNLAFADEEKDIILNKLVNKFNYNCIKNNN